jgi:signal transduction histidine kinase/DNA-binding LacI/PurR family transcriptional regulator/ActR/RegA family two-component response regulator
MVTARFHLAFFSLDLGNTFNESLLKSVVTSCDDFNLDLTVIHGGQLSSTHFGEAGRNFLYSAFDVDLFDGFLCADIFSFLNEKGIFRFLERFKSKPLVTMSRLIDGFPAILVDNQSGFKELAQQLLSQNCQSFLCLTGPPTNKDTQERLAALLEVLHDAGIKDSNIIQFPGDFSFSSGIHAVRTLKSQNRLNVDAMVCFNDNMAMGALVELKHLGIRVPQDLLLTGFDDTEESRSLIPSLTTVSLPIDDLGYRGVEAVAKLMSGEKIEKIKTVRGRFLLRSSSVRQALTQTLVAPAGILGHSYSVPIDDDAREVWTSLIDQIRTLKTFDQPPEPDLTKLESFVHRHGAIHAWTTSLEELSFKTIADIPEPRRWIAEVWFSKTLRQVENLLGRTLLNQKIFDRYRLVSTLETGEELITGLSMSQLGGILSRDLPSYGIDRFDLILFSKIKKIGHIAYSYRKSKETAKLSTADFNVSNILPGGLSDLFSPPLKHGNARIVDAVHIRDKGFGYAVFDVEDRAGLMIKSLRHQLSAAIYLGRLVEKIHSDNELLEKRIKQRTRELERSHQLLAHEIEERARMETEILKQKNLDSLGLLAAGLAHDFNNILMGVLGNVSLLELEIPSKDSTDLMIHQIYAALERARGLTSQLLTFSRGGAPVKVSTTLPEIVRETADFVLRTGSCVAVYNFAKNLWNVEADSGQLAQVLNNLLLNAVQSMPRGGKILISAQNVTIDKKNTHLNSGEYVHLSIHDEGPGLEPQVLEKVFVPYFTTKKFGTGLGLLISRNILIRHGGWLDLSSTPGSGTTIDLWIPRYFSNHKNEKFDSLPNQLEKLTRKKILVLDDEPTIRQLLEKLLRKLGHTCLSAAEGMSALNIFREALRKNEPFDGVILDLTIPGGMGGRELLRQLKLEVPHLRALASTGYFDAGDWEELKSEGFKNILRKPYTLPELRTAISDLFNNEKD